MAGAGAVRGAPVSDCSLGEWGPSGGVGSGEQVSHGLLKDLRVDPSHAIDSVRASDAQVGHVDALHCALLHQ